MKKAEPFRVKARCVRHSERTMISRLHSQRRMVSQSSMHRINICGKNRCPN